MISVRLAVIAFALVSAAATHPAQDRQVFRTDATVVMVDVSVRSSNRPVQGLTAADFVLTDKGVPQTIQVLPMADVGVDVTLVVDVGYLADLSLDRYRRDVSEVRASLGPLDRLRILAAGARVEEVASIADADLRDLEWMRLSGASSLHEAIAAALVVKPDRERRHLVVTLAAKFDGVSVLTAATVRAIARRADATLHIVGLQPCQAGRTTIYADGTVIGYVPERWPWESSPDWPRVTGVLPCDPQAFQHLSDAAEATGGRRHAPGFWTGSMMGAFRRAYDEFRSGYVLTYEPTGVPVGGWHDVEVDLLRPGRYELKAREGYFVGETKG